MRNGGSITKILEQGRPGCCDGPEMLVYWPDRSPTMGSCEGHWEAMKMKDLALFTIHAACLLAAATCWAAEDLVLVKDGQARARIVVGKDVTHVARFAARELQSYVRKSTGAALPIADALGNDGSVEIVIGAGRIAGQLKVTAAGLTRDAFHIKTVGRRIVIVGRDDAEFNIEKRLIKGYPRGVQVATLFGVYEFLERFVGVRWYLPGEIGEVTPKHRTLAVPFVNVTETPNKSGRFIHPNTGADDRDDPLPKKRQGVYKGGFAPGFEGKALAAFRRKRNLFFLRLRHQTIQGSGIHTMQHIISARKYGKSHPHFFAMGRGGNRLVNFKHPEHSHHCFTNPEAIRELIRIAKAALGDKPPQEAIGRRSWRGILWDTGRGKAFHILQDDGYNPCLCDTCQAFRKARGVESVGRLRNATDATRQVEADLVWSAITKVAQGIRGDFPKAWLSAAAYGPLARLPKATLPPNVMLARAAVPGPYTQFIAGRQRIEDARIRPFIEKFGKQGIGQFWNYANVAGWGNGQYRSHPGICGSLPRAYAAYYRRYRDIGNGSYVYLSSHRFAYDHLSIYVFYKYHWNPNRDIDALLKEYYRLFYGPASEPMERFWEEVEKKFYRIMSRMIDTPLGPVGATQDAGTIWGSIYDRKTIAQWKQCFAEAKRLTRGAADPVYAKRIAYMKRNVLDTIEDGFKENEAAAKFQYRRLRALRTDRPPVLDGRLTDAIWRKCAPQDLYWRERSRKSKVLPRPLPAARRATVRVAWDDRNLYVAIDSKDPAMSKASIRIRKDDSGQIYKNYHFSIMLNPSRGRRGTGYRLSIDPDGTWQDVAEHLADRSKPKKERARLAMGWNSLFKGKPRRARNGCVVELAIPFAGFKEGAPKAGGEWGANFSRWRSVKGAPRTMASWSANTPAKQHAFIVKLYQGFTGGKIEFVR